jgi:putative transposase
MEFLQGGFMSVYRRNYVVGGTYFFTVNLLDRKKTLLVDYVDCLRESVVRVRCKRPFEINAWVVLSDHMHAVWTLPEGDSDYSGRWREIKKAFNRYTQIKDWPFSSFHGYVKKGIYQEERSDFRHVFKVEMWVAVVGSRLCLFQPTEKFLKKNLILEINRY